MVLWRCAVSGDRSLISTTTTLVTRCGREKRLLITPAGASLRDTQSGCVCPSPASPSLRLRTAVALSPLRELQSVNLHNGHRSHTIFDRAKFTETNKQGIKKKPISVRTHSQHTHSSLFILTWWFYSQSDTFSGHVLVRYFPPPVCSGARSCYPHHLVSVSQDGS